jgi:hypothetical protein
VNAEDKHRTNGDDGDKAKADIIETATKVYNAVDREDVDDVIETDVKNEMVFIYMPVK